MNKKQQMKDILKETIEFYAEDPDNRRGIDEDGNCHYTWGNTHCAIGRYVKEEYQREDWEENDMSINELCDQSETEYNIDWCLREDVQGLDTNFWKNLQDFHDSHICWITKDDYNRDDEPLGLSIAGKNNYRVIENKIDAGGYDNG